MINERIYKQKFSVLEELCVDIILGLDFQSKHKSVILNYGGEEPPLEVCSMSSLNVPTPSLFGNLSKDCKPIAVKSRKYNVEQKFIPTEIGRLLKEDIIEQSKSPWRAKDVTRETSSHKKRLVIDYSQMINRFTELDAFLLPRIEETIARMDKYSVFSAIDLKSAYHQLVIREDDKLDTAFEAEGGLYQFKRMPFGLTNGVPCFQRTITQIVAEANLEEFVYPYLGNVYICGRSQEHDRILEKWEQLVAERNITYNEVNVCSPRLHLLLLDVLLKMEKLNLTRNISNCYKSYQFLLILNV